MASDDYERHARSGMNLVDCMRAVKRLGGSVARVRRTGEVRFLHHQLGSSGMIDGRRKDAPRHATTWLRRLERLVRSPNSH